MSVLKQYKVLALTMTLVLLSIVGASASPTLQLNGLDTTFKTFKVSLPSVEIEVKLKANLGKTAQEISSKAQEKAKEMAPPVTYSSMNYSSGSSSGDSSGASSTQKSSSTASEAALARSILAGYIARYPILRGVQVYIRDCPNNWQGCAYYRQGIILIDPDHTAPLSSIIAHEVQHIIDYRQDNDIDNNDYHK